MKKCVQCRTQIEEMVPLSVCCGGSGIIEKVTQYSKLYYLCMFCYSKKIAAGLTTSKTKLYNFLINLF